MSDVEIIIHEPEGVTVTISSLSSGDFFRWPTTWCGTAHAHVVTQVTPENVYYQSLVDGGEYSALPDSRVNQMQLTAATFRVLPC